MVSSQQHVLDQVVEQKTPHPKNTGRRGYSTGRHREYIYAATGGRPGKYASAGGRRRDYTASVCTCRHHQTYTRGQVIFIMYIVITYMSADMFQLTEHLTPVCQETCQAMRNTHCQGCRDVSLNSNEAKLCARSEIPKV